MADWKPPPFGTPVWIAIPAHDIDRAADFYSAIFKIPFKERKPEEGHFFDFTQNGLTITGGILKVPEKVGSMKLGHGGICLHWFVEDIDKSAILIKSAGGKMLGDKIPQGDSAQYQYFEDTEGTVGSIYMLLST